jgi:hypothetical protein
VAFDATDADIDRTSTLTSSALLAEDIDRTSTLTSSRSPRARGPSEHRQNTVRATESERTDRTSISTEHPLDIGRPWPSFRRSATSSRLGRRRLDRDPVLKVADPELLRALPTRFLLRSRRLWGCNAGGEETFALSRPAATIDAFISHSWLTPGWLKMAGLAFHLNATRAVAAAVLLLIAIHALELAGVYSFPTSPGYDDSRLFDGSDVVPSVRLQMHFVLPMVVFFAVLWYGQELPFGRRTCFLDKCCIHQTDESKKARGIKQLGAFLRHSKSMVVLWQPEYFTRLWCVYELAAFMHVNGGDCRSVSFLPLKLYVFAISLSIFHFIATVCFVVLLPWTLTHPEHAEWVAEMVPEAAQYLYLVLVCIGLLVVDFALPSPLLWIFCKWHMSDHKELLQQVREFEFENAECQEESDREFVRGQIEHWFGGVAHFEQYVRTALTERVEEMLHEQGPVPYSVVALGSLSHTLAFPPVIINGLQDGLSNMVGICIACASICFFTDTVAIHLTMGLAGTTFGDAPASGRSLLGRLSGPLSTVMIFSVCSAVPLALIAAPQWLAILVAVFELAVTSMLYFPRSALRRSCQRRP